MNDEDFSLIRSRMVALREGTGDATIDELAEWLTDELQRAVEHDLGLVRRVPPGYILAEIEESLNRGTPGLENYGLLNDPSQEEGDRLRADWMAQNEATLLRDAEGLRSYREHEAECSNKRLR